jgi:signal transduction histidine kinase
VTNAIDACGEDDAPGKTVTVRTKKPEKWAVEYQVIDTGGGMTKDVQDKIFQSFFSTKGTRGTGIGLMMTKRIVDQHQGIIEVTSEKAVGSIIRIKLPSHE